MGINQMASADLASAARNRVNRRALSVLIVPALSIALCGCGETELSGKIFDYMGVSSAAQAAAKQEPKMAARSGLVLPPDDSRLPVPGSAGPDDASAALNSVDDPDRRKVMAAAERARLHKAYCSGEMNWKERVNDKDATPKSPYGPCGFVGNALQQP